MAVLCAASAPITSAAWRATLHRFAWALHLVRPSRTLPRPAGARFFSFGVGPTRTVRSARPDDPDERLRKTVDPGLAGLRRGRQRYLRHLVTLREDRLAFGTGDGKAVRSPYVQHELAAYRAGEARAASKRDEFLVERPGEGGESA